MSGTKRVYNLEEKNYFKFFGIEEKQDISVRSLTTHYKKIVTLLNRDNKFLSKDKVAFAHRAFETLADPISRAKYILELNGVENDVRDGANAEDFLYINNLNAQYDASNTVDEILNFILELKVQTTFIKEQIQYCIDDTQNYNMASGLLNRFYEISTIHDKTKLKKHELELGIKHVVFDK
jgi:hypothetical protein